MFAAWYPGTRKTDLLWLSGALAVGLTHAQLHPTILEG